jgi:hypothetical protein
VINDPLKSVVPAGLVAHVDTNKQIDPLLFARSQQESRMASQLMEQDPLLTLTQAHVTASSLIAMSHQPTDDKGDMVARPSNKEVHP